MEQQLFSFPLFCAFLLFVLALVRIWKSKTSANLPPGPWKLPIIGDMHHFIGCRPHQRLTDMAKKYGPLMHLKLGEVSTIVVSSVDTAREVMKTHDLNFAHRPAFVAPSVVTYNFRDIAFAPYGEYWRQLRKLCVLELLSMKRVQSFRPIREEQVSKLVQDIKSNSGSEINLSVMIFCSTNNITLNTALGGKCKEQEEFLNISDTITKMTSGFCVADLFPSMKLLGFLSGFKKKLENVHKRSDKILQNIINDHKVDLNHGATSGLVAEDLVNVLLRVKDQDTLQFPLTENDIKAIILDIFVAGTETSSTTMEWIMSELMKNPEKMKKAQAEVRRACDANGGVDETELHELQYLKSVIKETLRLHPPLPLLLPRESRDNCEINGYHIPIKTRVVVNAWAINRDPGHWTDPENFIPERFLNSEVDYKGNDFEFIPFGAGRRVCPGIAYGIANLEIMLANLLYHFNWELRKGIKPEDLDMTESIGATARRNTELHLIPIPYDHPDVKPPS